MDPDTKRQIWQSVGQFFVVFGTNMLVFKDINAIMVIGIANAIYQPMLQAFLAALAIWGISKIGGKSS